MKNTESFQSKNDGVYGLMENVAVKDIFCVPKRRNEDGDSTSEKFSISTKPSYESKTKNTELQNIPSVIWRCAESRHPLRQAQLASDLKVREKYEPYKQNAWIDWMAEVRLCAQRGFWTTEILSKLLTPVSVVGRTVSTQRARLSVESFHRKQQSIPSTFQSNAGNMNVLFNCMCTDLLNSFKLVDFRQNIQQGRINTVLKSAKEARFPGS